MKTLHERLVYLYLFLTFFLWGSLYVVSKYVLDKGAALYGFPRAVRHFLPAAPRAHTHKEIQAR